MSRYYLGDDIHSLQAILSYVRRKNILNSERMVCFPIIFNAIGNWEMPGIKHFKSIAFWAKIYNTDNGF